jgi:hypothetical protein
LLTSKVVGLSVLSDADAARLDPALRHLGDLKTIEFHGAELSKAGLPGLRHLPRLEALHFSGGRVSDAGLESVGRATQLRALTFYCCTGVTDAGVAHLRGLKDLRWLRLYREDYPEAWGPNLPRVTDAGLAHLEGLTGLEHLDLMGQAVTDAGLAHLKGLTGLQQLLLSGGASRTRAWNT